MPSGKKRVKNVTTLQTTDCSRPLAVYRVLANQFQFPYTCPLQAAFTVSGLSYTLVAQAVSLSPSSPVDRGRGPRIGLASLPHGHVRAHSEGKPEGGLYHQQLQQDHHHMQQTQAIISN